MIKSIQDEVGYEPDEITQFVDSLPDEVLKAGEDALKESEPDYFDYGQGAGWHFKTVKSMLLAALQASRKDHCMHLCIHQPPHNQDPSLIADKHE